MILLYDLIERIPSLSKQQGNVGVACPNCGTVFWSSDLIKAFQNGSGYLVWCACGEEYTELKAHEARVKYYERTTHKQNNIIDNGPNFVKWESKSYYLSLNKHEA